MNRSWCVYPIATTISEECLNFCGSKGLFIHPKIINQTFKGTPYICPIMEHTKPQKCHGSVCFSCCVHTSCGIITFNSIHIHFHICTGIDMGNMYPAVHHSLTHSNFRIPSIVLRPNSGVIVVTTYRSSPESTETPAITQWIKAIIRRTHPIKPRILTVMVRCGCPVRLKVRLKPNGYGSLFPTINTHILRVCIRSDPLVGRKFDCPPKLTVCKRWSIT